MHRSTLIKPPLPSFLYTHNLSTSLFWCKPPYIVIVFLDFLFKSFSLLTFHWIIPAPYMNIATVHVFVTVTLFLPFSLDFTINLCLYLYPLVVFSFISFLIQLYLNWVPFLSNLLHHFAIWQPYPFTFYNFTSLHCKDPTFLYPELHANVGAKDIHSSHKSICLFFNHSIQF